FGNDKWDKMTRALTVTPAWTCIRLPFVDRDQIFSRLQQEVQRFNEERKAQQQSKDVPPSICNLKWHETLEDCARLDFAKCAINMDALPPSRIIVDTKCGEAVLRGANVFAPGVKAATAGMYKD